MPQPWLRASIPITKPIVYVDMDGVLCDFEKRVEELKLLGINPNQADNHEKAFRDLEPLPGALEAWEYLQENYETYVLSTAPWRNLASWTEKRIWVEKYLGKSAHKKLILTHNKGLLIGQFLVDDRIANGVADFKGEHLHFGSEKFPNWKSITSYLDSKILCNI